MNEAATDETRDALAGSDEGACSADDAWNEGEAPKDGQRYELRRRCSLKAGHPDWTAWQSMGWWDGSQYVRHNQMHGGVDVLLMPTHWRNIPPNGFLQPRR